MRKIISLICLLLPIAAYADELQLRENAPDRYVVVKGDTLWDISAKFFKDPWKWTQIWGYNKDSIKDPHWIYPGNIVYLDPNTRTLAVAEPNTANALTTNASDAIPSVGDTPSASSGVVKLSPKIREVPSNHEAIPVISLKTIGPFLARPLVVGEEELKDAPRVDGTYEQRHLLGPEDVAYSKKIPQNQGVRWQVYRPGIAFTDPDTDEILGYEVSYLGDASLEGFDKDTKISTLKITHSILEIQKGDYFAQAGAGFSNNYQPHAPSSKIDTKVISIYGGVQQAGQNAVVTINKGKRDGLENGHVLALYQKGEVLKSKGWFTPNTVLPDVRYGLLFVFRVFDKVSYALVMEAKFPVKILDRASTPE